MNEPDRNLQYASEAADTAAAGLLDSFELTNSHFPDNPKFIRPNVRMVRPKPGGPTKLYFDDVEVNYPIGWGSINVQRQGSRNILTLSIVVGDVSMDDCPPSSEV
jgi:hypothetical protein